jgi:tRNA1Val (adenine37-N6)-methyltransferase
MTAITTNRELTADSFFNGRIGVKQDRRGYRFSIDAVILAHHVQPRPEDTLIDLGTGCAIIPLILAYRHSDIQIRGIEIQPSLAEIARLNVAENRLQARIDIHCMDLRSVDHRMLASPADIVTANPPFRKKNSGRINPNRQSAVARHEIEATLAEVVAAACRLLRKGGRFLVVYTADRTTDLLCAMRSAGIEPKRCRMVHAKRPNRARLVLVEGVKGARPAIVVTAPLVIYNEDGSYTDEIEAMFRP